MWVLHALNFVELARISCLISLGALVQEKRLLDEIAKVADTLTPDEKRRNETRENFFFVNKHHPVAEDLLALGMLLFLV